MHDIHHIHDMNMKKKMVLYKPKNVVHMDSNTGSAEGNSGPADVNSGSGANNITDIEYHQRELALARLAVSSLNKTHDSLTPDERMAIEAYKEIEQYDAKSLHEAIGHHEKSLKQAIKDSGKVYNSKESTSIKRGADYNPQESLVNKYTKGDS